jgi:hypothetical protein
MHIPFLEEKGVRGRCSAGHKAVYDGAESAQKVWMKRERLWICSGVRDNALLLNR